MIKSNSIGNVILAKEVELLNDDLFIAVRKLEAMKRRYSARNVSVIKTVKFTKV